MWAQHRAMTWAGRILSGLIGLMMSFSAVMKLSNPPEVSEQFVSKFGYPEAALFPIGITEIACVLLYLFPRTSFLGAILLTGYLGGATATHVRVADSFVAPIIVGVCVWLGLFLREPQLRALVPILSPEKPVSPPV